MTGKENRSSVMDDRRVLDRRTAETLRTLYNGIGQTHPLILCFVSGVSIPRYCAPMARAPLPPLGDAFDENFLRVVEAAQRQNASIHDGAIVVSRQNNGDFYRVSGWSFRLIPPMISEFAEANRGSAYNSAICMSLSENVDAVALLSKHHSDVFAGGRRYAPSEL
ncbi:MAG: hypothetical protein ABTQ31_16000 [Rhizobiaceae bacterium]